MPALAVTSGCTWAPTRTATASAYGSGGVDAVGLKMYCDQTTGSLLLGDQALRRRHLRAWAAASPKPVAVHAEGETLAAVLELVRELGVWVHFCHVSSAAEVSSCSAKASETGCPSVSESRRTISISPTPTARGSVRFGLVKPPLKTPADREALWAAVADGTVDTIESDHAPHTRAEKRVQDPPYGLPGLETTVALMVLAMREGRLSEARLIMLLATNAQHLFSLTPPVETYTLVDTAASYVISDDELRCSSGWSPFSGMRVWGRVREVRIRGRLAFDGEDVFAEPGSGKRLLS